MALVDSCRRDEQLHGSVEMIEDSSQIPPPQSQEHANQCLDVRSSVNYKMEPSAGKQNKDDIVLVTVKPLSDSASSSQTSVSEERQLGDREIERTTSNDDDSQLSINQEAGRRRYSVMMASLASARMEESKAALRMMNSRPSPSNSAGVSANAAVGGWAWQTRRDREDDFSMREKYFSEEL